MERNKGGKTVLKNILIVIAIILLMAAIVVFVYLYRCTHYWQKDAKETEEAGFIEKQVTLDDGSIINYGEGPDNGISLLLIHGQAGAWEDYETVLVELSKNYHVFAIDCYGHGGSSHDVSKYYLDKNGDDLIWFTNNVIKDKTIVSGHSSGGILAAYVAAYGGENIKGVVLEDPPVFSTEPDYFEKSFAYVDTYKPMHDYLNSDKSECWEAYYLRHCLWGQLYMKNAVGKMADSAQKQYEKNPDKPMQISFMPGITNSMFLHMKEYDLRFGDHFYDYSWHAGISHDKLLEDIKVPAIFIHCIDQYSEDGILMAATSNEQARRAVSLINNCQLVELKSGHDVHREHPDVFIDAVEKLNK